jgi:hypothetical protein
MWKNSLMTESRLHHRGMSYPAYHQGISDSTLPLSPLTTRRHAEGCRSRPGLMAAIQAWRHLPDAIRAGISAMVRTAGQKKRTSRDVTDFWESSSKQQTRPILGFGPRDRPNRREARQPRLAPHGFNPILSILFILSHSESREEKVERRALLRACAALRFDSHCSLSPPACRPLGCLRGQTTFSSGRKLPLPRENLFCKL